MTHRMEMRDSTGRRISILNDRDVSPVTTRSISHKFFPPTPPTAPIHDTHAPRVSPVPATPELLRANSYDSYVAAEPMSPLTPLNGPAVSYPSKGSEPHRSPWGDYHADLLQQQQQPLYAGMLRRSSTYSDDRSVAYEDQYVLNPGFVPVDAHTPASTTTSTSERPVKRFPCRYRESLGCNKTFTTSGHASRHSKIHTAEKAIECTFPGCGKKFTRNDNMKQHRETHLKDKPRSSASRPSLSSIGHRRSSTTSSRSSNRSRASAAAAAYEPRKAPPPPLARTTSGGAFASTPSPAEPPLPSPLGGVFNLRDLGRDLQTRPSARRTPSTGLDTLAMVATASYEDIQRSPAQSPFAQFPERSPQQSPMESPDLRGAEFRFRPWGR